MHHHCYGQQGMLKNPHIYRKERGTKVPRVLWSGLTVLLMLWWEMLGDISNEKATLQIRE